MSIPRPPKPAKLVVGAFMKNRGLLHAIADELESTFGAIDMISPWLPFDFTTYYESEMGSCLSRRVMVFKPLIDQEQLADIKITTNQLERQHTVDGNRQVNLLRVATQIIEFSTLVVWRCIARLCRKYRGTRDC